MAQKVKNPCKSDLQGFLRFGGVDGTLRKNRKSMISLIFLQFTLQKICYHLCYHFGGITEANSKCKRSATREVVVSRQKFQIGFTCQRFAVIDIAAEQWFSMTLVMD